MATVDSSPQSTAADQRSPLPGRVLDAAKRVARSRARRRASCVFLVAAGLLVLVVGIHEVSWASGAYRVVGGLGIGAGLLALVAAGIGCTPHPDVPPARRRSRRRPSTREVGELLAVLAGLLLAGLGAYVVAGQFADPDALWNPVVVTVAGLLLLGGLATAVLGVVAEGVAVLHGLRGPGSLAVALLSLVGLAGIGQVWHVVYGPTEAPPVLGLTVAASVEVPLGSVVPVTVTGEITNRGAGRVGILDAQCIVGAATSNFPPYGGPGEYSKTLHAAEGENIPYRVVDRGSEFRVFDVVALITPTNFTYYEPDETSRFQEIIFVPSGAAYDAVIVECSITVESGTDLATLLVSQPDESAGSAEHLTVLRRWDIPEPSWLRRMTQPEWSMDRTSDVDVSNPPELNVKGGPFLYRAIVIRRADAPLVAATRDPLDATIDGLRAQRLFGVVGVSAATTVLLPVPDP